MRANFDFSVRKDHYAENVWRNFGRQQFPTQDQNYQSWALRLAVIYTLLRNYHFRRKVFFYIDSRFGLQTGQLSHGLITTKPQIITSLPASRPNHYI